jgi:hypothetical protein
MGFFSNPLKAVKGFVNDPVGRIGKDTGLWNKDNSCTPAGYANACGSGANTGAAAGAAFATFKGMHGALAGAAGGAAAGCVKSSADYAGICKTKPFNPKP